MVSYSDTDEFSLWFEDDTLQDVGRLAQAIMDVDSAWGANALSALREQVYEDLLWTADNDPAAHGVDHVQRTYLSARAVAYYRLAHMVWASLEERDLARRISERAKRLTGVDIHPGAVIGRRISIDHGYGTVIGETTEIGDSCVLLHGVTLGARTASEPAAKRHPTIGRGVRIGPYARVLGPVRIGDGCELGTGVVVTRDIPDNCRVVLRQQAQILRWPSGAQICPVIEALRPFVLPVGSHASLEIVVSGCDSPPDTVVLSRPGVDDLLSHDVRLDGAHTVTCAFDLTMQQPGTRTLRVEYGNGTWCELTYAVELR